MTWMLTNKCEKHDLLDPFSRPVDWNEIAWAMSQLCRFTGHTKAINDFDTVYSVLHHSCLVHDLAERDGKTGWGLLGALLHDAPEAFTGDISTPMEGALGLGEKLEIVTDEHVAWLGGAPALKAASSEQIIQASRFWFHIQAARPYDLQALILERDQLIGKSPEPWGKNEVAVPDGVLVPRWRRDEAVKQFLLRLSDLQAELGLN